MPIIAHLARARLKVLGVILGLCVVLVVVTVMIRGNLTSLGSIDAAIDASAEARRAGQRSTLCTSANVAGVGLRGEYFAESGYRGAPLLSRVDSSIDFSAPFDWPSDRGSARPKSARWTGWVKAPITGRYRFHIEPMSARVQVSRLTVAGTDAAPDAALELVAGRFYPISVEVGTIDDMTSRIRLEWTAPHGARFVIPRVLLNLPTETVTVPRA